jgi:hypothetical protein
MTRKELKLSKLQALSDDEVAEAIRQLTHHVKARLRFGTLVDRTKFGAHNEKFLGMDAIDFYVGESFKRLFDPDGWDWKFERFSFYEQLARIATKLISDKVKEYRGKVERMPDFDPRDVSDVYDLKSIALENIPGNEELYSRLIEAAHKVSSDDDNLHYFTMLYFDGANAPTIAEEMGLTIAQVYVLRRKLVRRLMNIREKIAE